MLTFLYDYRGDELVRGIELLFSRLPEGRTSFRSSVDQGSGAAPGVIGSDITETRDGTSHAMGPMRLPTPRARSRVPFPVPIHEGRGKTNQTLQTLPFSES